MTIPKPGESFHVLHAMSFPTTPNQSVAASRGQTYQITPEMIEATKDRTGFTWLSIIDNPEAQIEKWGRVNVAPGECPEFVTWWNGDPATHSLARTLARESVVANTKDPVTRAEKLAEIDRIYGKVSTSQTISYLA